VSSYEKGTRHPSNYHINMLAKLYEVTPDSIYYGILSEEESKKIEKLKLLTLNTSKKIY